MPEITINDNPDLQPKPEGSAKRQRMSIKPKTRHKMNKFLEENLEQWEEGGVEKCRYKDENMSDRTVAEKFQTSENVVRYARTDIFGELVGSKEMAKLVEKKAKEEIAELREQIAGLDMVLDQIVGHVRKLGDLVGEHEVLFNTLRGYAPLSGLLPPKKETESKNEVGDRRVPRAA
jgi:hypothetical protein